MTRSCFAHNHMTPKEFGVYQYALAVSHTSGKFFFDGRGTASQFADTKKDAVYPVVASLEKKGWLVDLKAPKRNAFGMLTATEYQVLNHEDWENNHTGQCRKPVSKLRQAPVGKLRQVPVAESRQAPVVESQLTSLDFSTDQSANSNSPVGKLRHKYVKRIQKREESERKDCAAPVPESGQAQPSNQNSSPSPTSCEKTFTEESSQKNEEQMKLGMLAEQRQWQIARDKRVQQMMDAIETEANRWCGRDKNGDDLIHDRPQFNQKGKDLIRQALLKIENGRYEENYLTIDPGGDGWPDDPLGRGSELDSSDEDIMEIVREFVESSDAFQLKNFSTNLGSSLYGALKRMYETRDEALEKVMMDRHKKNSTAN